MDDLSNGNSNCACSEVPVLKGGERGRGPEGQGGGKFPPRFVHIRGGKARPSWFLVSLCALRESKESGS